MDLYFAMVLDLVQLQIYLANLLAKNIFNNQKVLMAKFNKIVNEVTSRLSLHLFQYETLQQEYKDKIQVDDLFRK